MATGSGPGRGLATGPLRAGSPRQRRGRITLLKAVLVVLIALALADLVTTPWVFHIGDRFTPQDVSTTTGPSSRSSGAGGPLRT